MLPDVLKKDEVNTVETWGKVRRPEIMRMFETWVYGMMPVGPLDCLEAKVTKTEYLTEGAAKKETYHLHMERKGELCGSHYRVLSSATREAAEVVLMINPFSRNQALDCPGKELDHIPYSPTITHGCIGVHADVDEPCADDAKYYREGLWELFPGSMEGAAAWGAIGVWARAASCIVGYLIIQDSVECGRIVVCGCSRAGKVALWHGAQDGRIGPVISGISSCAGAAVTRGKTREHTKDIVAQFPYWAYKHHAPSADWEEELPVDQHMLLALCTSRPLYVSGVSENSQTDP